MRILLVCPDLPYPPTDGGSIATFEPLRRLAERGHDITLLAYRHATLENNKVAPLETYCRLELVEHDNHNRLIPALMNLPSPVPYTIAKYISKEMQRQIATLLSSHSFDLVQLEHLSMMGCFLGTLGNLQLPIVLRQHNVESLLAARYARTQKGLRRIYALVHAHKLRRYEADACGLVDMCLAITSEDAESLRQLNPAIRLSVVPAGVEPEYYRPYQGQEEPFTIVSVATMDWPPNIDGILWFHNHVLPIVRREFPQVKFYIVGKNPPPKIQTLARQGEVFVTGFVDDVRTFFAMGSVFVVPLRSGAGVRIKILQAMAMAKAIVSTAIGAEGIDARHEKDLLLADDPKQFAHCVTRLLEDSALRRELGDNGRDLVCRQYTWDHSVDSQEQAYQAVLSSWRLPYAEQESRRT